MQTHRRKKIENICDEIWQQHNLSPGFNFDLLLNHLNIKLNKKDFSKKVSAVLIIIDQKKIIMLNKNDNKYRQRFSLGHELGHLFLGHKKSLNVSKAEVIMHKRDVTSSQGIDKDEIEANFFAATLLMPGAKIKEDINFNISFDQNVDQISNKFKTSHAAATLRLKYLGYI